MTMEEFKTLVETLEFTVDNIIESLNNYYKFKSQGKKGFLSVRYEVNFKGHSIPGQYIVKASEADETLDVAIEYLRDLGIFYTPGIKYDSYYDEKQAQDALRELRRLYSNVTGRVEDVNYIQPAHMIDAIQAEYTEECKRYVEDVKRIERQECEKYTKELEERIKELNNKLYNIRISAHARPLDSIEDVVLDLYSQKERADILESRNKYLEESLDKKAREVEELQKKVDEYYELNKKILSNSNALDNSLDVYALKRKLERSERLRKYWLSKYESEHERANSLNKKHIQDLKTLDKAQNKLKEANNSAVTYTVALNALKVRVRKAEKDLGRFILYRKAPDLYVKLSDDGKSYEGF